MGLPVNVFAMTNRGDGHDSTGIVNLVKNSGSADSNTPTNLSALQFLAAAGRGFVPSANNRCSISS
jgi:hypothetical protein